MTFASLLTQTFTRPKWTPAQLPSLEGKVAIVTGATAGIGKATATELARKGAHVFVVGRSEAKTTATVDDIKRETESAKVDMLLADFLDLASVEAAADAFLARGLPLDILVNNAGIMDPPFELSKQGIESTFAVNHFAAAAFTARLLSAIKKAPSARIVIVSSLSHQIIGKSGIKYQDLNNKDNYKLAVRYGETKLAGVQFTRELQRRLEESGVKNVLVNAVHPGTVKTDIVRNHPLATTSVVDYLFGAVALDSKGGAITQLYVAGDPEVEEKQHRGKYFVPFAALAEPSATARDEALSTKTWEWTQEILQKHHRADWSWAAVGL
ncbi:hypothetical protein HK105_201552 [Polyrhizophydium stewartii]|uniref:Uncharacterized protein n=1 Tax=Polyrhizophydium stewartii TaxID=2732419 RepID=A0ABR4NGQ9_9FUNG